MDSHWEYIFAMSRLQKKERMIVMCIKNCTFAALKAIPSKIEPMKTNNTPAKRTRESNIELLRIVAMLMIVTHHVVLNVSNTYNEMYLQRSCEPKFYLYNALVIYGVNLFVMISGYCGIRATLPKGVSLYLKCLLYGVLGWAVYALIPGNSISAGQLEPYVYVLSGNTSWWFVRYYVFLFLLSPFINKILEHSTRKEVYMLTAILTVLSVYFGWMNHDVVNQNGYNLFNFIWMYCIGHCLRFHTDEIRSSRYVRWYALLLWVVSVALTAWGEYHHWSQVVFGYNNPFVVTGTIGLMVLFLTFDFRSKPINMIASSTLGVYLIHCHFQVGPYFINYASNHYTSDWQIPLFASGIFAVCSVLAMAIDAMTSNGLRTLCEKTTKRTAIIALAVLTVTYIVLHA